MKVIVSVGGKFHAFELAKQLEKRGYLKKLLTSYPYFKVLKDGLPRDKIISLPLKEIGWLICDKKWFLHSLFDKQVAQHINAADIFVGWANTSLNSLKKAKAQGSITIIERGSTHIEYQRDILREEYARLGLRSYPVDRRLMEMELQEYAEADYVSVPSEFAINSFLEKGVPENKLIRIAYGVDINTFRPIPKKDNTFRIVYVGSMTLRKGLPYLLEAVSELRLKDLELCLIGSLSNEIKPFFKKYNGCFRYLGKVNHCQLYKYYSQGSVFVLPSIEEGMSLVILQAMACGMPVICTTNTGGSDVVRDGVDGFIIPIRDAGALKEKIMCLYENRSLCKAMGLRALKRVTGAFTWDNYGDKMVNAYIKLLYKRKG